MGDTRSRAGARAATQAPAQRAGTGLMLANYKIDEAEAEKDRRRQLGLNFYHGYKLAYLAPHGDSVAFAPLRTWGYRYGVNADAVCLYDHVHDGEKAPIPTPHKSPTRPCECGFYSLVLASHLGEPSNASWTDKGLEVLAATLEVDLTGTVIEGDVGFISEHIDVFNVTLPNLCCWCGDVAIGVGLIKNELFFAPTCKAKCAPGGLRSLNWLSDHLGTKVAFAPLPAS